MNNENSKNREIIFASLILVFCVLSFFIGLISTTNEKSQIAAEMDESGIKSGLVGGFANKEHVKVIGLEGVIYDSFQSRSPFSSIQNIANLKQELKATIKNNKTKAVIIRVNSPGGTVAASQEVYQLVQKVREAGKPVIVSVSDICASGCYYIASAADAIVANRGSLTGSIGVISQGLNFKDLLSKYGVKNQTFTAGKYKDIGSSLRDITPEEQRIMQELLNSSYRQFLNDISVSREIDLNKLRPLAEGLIYTGEQAKSVGLVDYLGTYEDSKDIIKEILASDKYNYEKTNSLKFVETWKSTKFDSFQDIFSMSMQSLITSIKHSLGLNASGSSSSLELQWKI